MNWLTGVGYLIVLVTHVYMLVFGLPAPQAAGHALINLIAVGLLVYAQKA